MPGVTLQVESLTKVFGHRRPVTAVDDLSFTVQPGRVTGFLGPNGSGKTTTLRCLLGLVSPTSGSALIGDSRYHELPDPTRAVGAALEASGFHPGRTARNHLRVVAAAAGLPDSRVDDVLETVGLTDAARRRVVEYSLGMRQRLALAAALLGQPDVLILDEPANGLDPEGIAWLRFFLRDQAASGCTVLVSSHVLSEVQQTVDDVVIISRGKLVHAGALSEIEATGRLVSLVRAPEAARLADVLRAAGDAHVTVDIGDDGALTVNGMTAEQVGHLAFVHNCELHELASQTQDLERLFLELTGGDA
ncbi:MAG: ATP-binding cassette domain-containing protein [Actinomycetes bacterium]